MIEGSIPLIRTNITLRILRALYSGMEYKLLTFIS
nr:MAG TPA: hypothetical protein [Caudoviricetes sp.]